MAEKCVKGFYSVLFFLGIMGAVLFLLPGIFRIEPRIVMSGSMEPAISTGSIAELYEKALTNRAICDRITGMGYGKERIKADCAEPKSITDLRTYGLQARPCTKRPGCVNYRIKWLQKRTLVVTGTRYE